MILDRIFDELETANASCDALHRYTDLYCHFNNSQSIYQLYELLHIFSNLRNEYENGRLLRLLLKLGFMNER